MLYIKFTLDKNNELYVREHGFIKFILLCPYMHKIKYFIHKWLLFYKNYKIFTGKLFILFKY